MNGPWPVIHGQGNGWPHSITLATLPHSLLPVRQPPSQLARLPSLTSTLKSTIIKQRSRGLESQRSGYCRRAILRLAFKDELPPPTVIFLTAFSPITAIVFTLFRLTGSTLPVFFNKTMPSSAILRAASACSGVANEPNGLTVPIVNNAGCGKHPMRRIYSYGTCNWY